MAKASVYIVLFLISFNASAAMLDATGVADDLGLSTSPNEPEELQKAQQESKEFSPGQGGAATLFGLYGSLAGVLETIFNAMMPGAAMLKNAGLPEFYVHFAFTLATLVPALDLVSFLRSGGDLV